MWPHGVWMVLCRRPGVRPPVQVVAQAAGNSSGPSLPEYSTESKALWVPALTYKERSRSHRRTVFSSDDWIRHRATERYLR